MYPRCKYKFSVYYIIMNEKFNELNCFQLGCDGRFCKCVNAKWKATEEQFQYLDFKDYSVYTGTAGYALLKLRKDPNNPKNLKVSN